MKVKIISLGLAGVFLLNSCASSTIIQSNPAGAKLYVDGQAVGTTPYTLRDSKIIGSSTDIKLEKEGFQTLNSSISKDEEPNVGPIIGGFFCLFPFLWALKYKPTHNFDMNLADGSKNPSTSPWEQPKDQNQNSTPPASGSTQPAVQPGTVKSKADRLRELKQLLDEKLITQEEYEKERKKILDEK